MPVRLDAWIADQVPDLSRERVKDSIRAGKVWVDGKTATKPSAKVKPGALVRCEVAPPPPVEALPEDIPLDVLYEDDSVIVVDKPAGMVTHPAPGNYSGTLVNALLHHLGLGGVRVEGGGRVERVDGGRDVESDDDDDGCIPGGLEGAEEGPGGEWVIRPGIVHRLDKGTTGAMVVAKNAGAKRALSDQFRDRTVDRSYLSVTCGVPSPMEGRITTNVGRSPHDRLKMTTFPQHSAKGKHASSRYRVLEELAGGAAAVVEWRLDTGRTHQIRVHAQHIGHPLVADTTYGGTCGAALQRFEGSQGQKRELERELGEFGRPCLHARTLGFTHPVSGERLGFESPVPPDMIRLLEALRSNAP
ncbi:unnamed protein product [Pedinophyceae sp. YPF-701]|nr:unnamed protein product [Pedinophyceae sp. YPF-701]